MGKSMHIRVAVNWAPLFQKAGSKVLLLHITMLHDPGELCVSNTIYMCKYSTDCVYNRHFLGIVLATNIYCVSFYILCGFHINSAQPPLFV